MAAAALAAGGCGGGQSDPDAVREAVGDFTKAFAEGDGERGCDLLTAEAREQFVKRVKVLTKATDCPSALRRTSQAAGGELTDAFRTAKVSDVQVNGESATAKLSASGASTTVGLAKEGEEWRLTGVPGL